MSKPLKIHTIDSLKERTIEVGDCWIWQGYMANGSPQVYYQGKVKTVRRVMRELISGVAPAKHLSIGTKCGDPKCINPDHFICRTRQQHMSHMACQLDQKDIGRRIKLREAAKKRGLQKLTDDQIKDILASDLSGAELGRRLNVSRGLIGLIRRGKSRTITAQTNNPFAGLMR